jgi:hypothetical protein
MSRKLGMVGNVNVSVFASPDGPRCQVYVLTDWAELTHDDVRALQDLLRKAEKLLVAQQRKTDRRLTEHLTNATRPAPDAPRWQHRDYALLHNYCWLPCPRCGREWGGHEEARGRIEIGPTSAMRTCCPDEGKPVDPQLVLATRRARGEPL